MTKIEKTTHLFLIAVCCASLAALGQQYWTRRTQPAAKPVVSPTGALTRRVQLGDKFPLADIDWHLSLTNVVLDVRSGCHFCEESMPFYRSLIDARKKHSATVGVVAVSSDPPDVLKAYLASANVSVDRIIQAKPGPLGIPGTPTILLIDTDGIVRGKFIGKLGSDEENALLSMIDTPGRFPPATTE